jgi:glycerol-1-phosphate dehydrogenase [NAD(P)+]
VGDVVGKYSCLNDRKVSALIHGEYFCQKVYDLVMEAAETVESLAEAAVARDEAALGALMEALVAVGFEMSYVGNSRPASGSEHHLSHFFEITGILEDKPYFSHGIDVVYSAVVTAAIRERVMASKPQPFAFDRAAWEANIRRVYSTSADEVIRLQDKMGWYREDGFANVAEKWDEICKLLAQAPNEERMRQIVARIGLDYGEFEALYGKDKLADAVLYAKDLKDRYTVLWLNEQVQ